MSQLTASSNSLSAILVRQAIRYVTGLQGTRRGHRLGCHWAARWLDCPTEKCPGTSACAAGECWDRGRVQTSHRHFLAPVWVIGVTDLDAAARLAAETAPESERGAAVSWQVAAVRAISRGEEPPPE